MSRIVKLALVGIVSILAAASLTSSAAANGSGGDYLVKCEFDCASKLAPIENPTSGVDFDFDIGLKATSDDLSIRILTPGSVYIVGDVMARGDVKLTGPLLYLDANIIADRVRLEGDDFPTIDVDVPSVLTSEDLELGSSFMSPDSVITTFGRDLDIIDEMLGKTSGKSNSSGTTYVKISAMGDVYLDVSMVKLDRLYVNAGTSIVLSNEPGMMIPEPTTALLLGLGLVGLAAPRLRNND